MIIILGSFASIWKTPLHNLGILDIKRWWLEPSDMVNIVVYICQVKKQPNGKHKTRENPVSMVLRPTGFWWWALMAYFVRVIVNSL